MNLIIISLFGPLNDVFLEQARAGNDAFFGRFVLLQLPVFYCISALRVLLLSDDGVFDALERSFACLNLLLQPILHDWAMIKNMRLLQI